VSTESTHSDCKMDTKTDIKSSGRS
jgi:hypothetical protein